MFSDQVYNRSEEQTSSATQDGPTAPNNKTKRKMKLTERYSIFGTANHESHLARTYDYKRNLLCENGAALTVRT